MSIAYNLEVNPAGVSAVSGIQVHKFENFADSRISVIGQADVDLNVQKNRVCDYTE